MRSDILYVTDIVEAADATARFLDDVGREAFLTDELRQSAVLYKLIIIGEASSHVSPDLRVVHPEIEWSEVVRFGNFAIHNYFSVNQESVWRMATEAGPLLRKQFTAVLAAMIADENQASADHPA